MYQASSDRYHSMKYRSCGNSGLRLPAVSLGLHILTWQIIMGRSREVLRFILAVF